MWQLARNLGYGFNGEMIDTERALKIMKSLPNDFPKAKYDIVRLSTKPPIHKVQKFFHILVEGANMGYRKAI